MRKDARLNLERVLAAARQCFAEHGATVTMEEVAQRAGVGVGTLYRRFGNRAGLVEALYDDALQQIRNEASALATHPDPWEALARWCAAYVDVLATKRTLLSELTPLFEKHPELAEGQRRRAKATFDAFLKRAQASGRVRMDVEAVDIIALLNATMSAGPPSARLLDIVLEGIREKVKHED